jgi:hypothetical protein
MISSGHTIILFNTITRSNTKKKTILSYDNDGSRVSKKDRHKVK